MMPLRWSQLLGPCLGLALCAVVAAADWPTWGRDATRNMATSARRLPASFGPGTRATGSDHIDIQGAQNVRWLQKLGSQTYGNPTVANGRLYVGTNNASPRDPKFKGDYSMVMAFEAKSGKYLWQLGIPKLGAGKVSDWEYLGVCSSPTVDGNVLYVLSNRGEVLALDARGMANGNQGPFLDEGQYMAGPGKDALPVGKQDGDILWRYDMRQELGVFPHNITSSSVLVVGSRLYVTTSNGVDWSHRNIPAPFSPSLIVLDKRTGKLLGEEASGISERLMHAGWSSPSAGRVGGKKMIFFGAGDGFLYGFDPVPQVDDEGMTALRELFRFDANPAAYRTKDGKPVRYGKRAGPSEIIATPVFHRGKVYVAIGQDPEHGSGKGSLSCVDPSKTGDISTSGLVWRFDDIGRSISTVAIHKGLIYAADLSGYVYCLDAKTGALHWKHDTEAHIWGSPVVADGKVYIGNEDGILTVLAAGTKREVLGTVQLHSPLYASVVVAGDTLYVPTHAHLYAVASPRSRAK